MSWSDFHGQITKDPISTKGISNKAVLSFMGLFLLCIVSYPILLVSRPDVAIAFRFAFFGLFVILLLWQILFRSKKSKDEIIGSFSLLENKYLVIRDGEAEQKFNVTEITSLNIYMKVIGDSNNIELLITDKIECRCVLLSNKKSYRFNFCVPDIRQKENLSNICVKWKKEGYKVDLIPE